MAQAILEEECYDIIIMNYDNFVQGITPDSRAGHHKKKKQEKTLSKPPTSRRTAE